MLFLDASQGKLSDVDINSVEARLTEVTTRYNDAKRAIADAKAKLEASQRDAENMKDKADDLVSPTPAAIGSANEVLAGYLSCLSILQLPCCQTHEVPPCVSVSGCNFVTNCRIIFSHFLAF